MQRQNYQAASRKSRASRNLPPEKRNDAFAYFSELLIVVNLSLRLEPSPLATAMMASEVSLARAISRPSLFPPHLPQSLAFSSVTRLCRSYRLKESISELASGS